MATGVILALSRAIGETAPLIVVGAVSVIAFNPDGLGSQFSAMPIQIFDWISRASNDINDYRPLAAAGILLLMILLLAMNSVAIWLRNRYEQKW
jgi:phosphate transport system permease protein